MDRKVKNEGRIHRRGFLVGTAGLTIFAIINRFGNEAVGSGSVRALDVADLRDQLKGGLRTRRPSHLQFINKVVAKVEEGKLPLHVVMAVFKWSRPKRPHPFPYFQNAVRRHALKYGVVL